MDDRALLQHQLAVSRQILMRSLDGISDEEARKTPSDLTPIVWQVGHIALANYGFARRNIGFVVGADVPPSEMLPGNSAALFKTGTGGPAAYPVFGDVVGSAEASQDALARAVAEADLSAPNEGPRGLGKTQAEAFAFAVTHCSYHIGKINTLRALLGKPRLFG
jgi:DinB family protein